MPTDNEKWTRVNRIVEVIRHEIRKEVVGEIFGANTKVLKQMYTDNFSNVKDGDPVWAVWITTRTGLDKETVGLEYFASEEAAEKAVQSMTVGTRFGDGYG